MKRLFLVIPLFCAALSVSAQSAKEEICQIPALAAGKYYAYQAPDVQLTPAPEGYEPFYISMFARHGSRYLTKQKKYDKPLAILRHAERQGILTDDGKRALKVVESLAKEADGRYGELTPKGAEQHRELVRRMFAHYPQVFADGVHVDARSTYKTRAFLSMTAGCVELKGLNPKLNITNDASNHDLYYIKYKNEPYEAIHLANMDSVYHAADSVYVHPARLMKQLFTHPEVVEDPTGLMMDLFELDGISQSSYNQPDLAFLFNEDERYDLWQRNNFEWYYEKGASPLSDACMYKVERNLLHDTNLAPLATLMGCNHLSASTADWQKIAEKYRTYRLIPMCGNVQLIFFRKPDDEDILVKLLLNEREVTLPVKTDCAPFYHWKDVRAYWMQVVESIDLPEVEVMQED